ncbi:MAG: glutathione S-transferase family protein [Xanthomonadales bacterium]|nr:glutathione S-transferase family protein [Xanthomonadales bacterium]
MYRLVIANRNYSSWSLRAWLYLAESGVPFEEIRIPLFTGDWESAVARYSPSGRVPVLLDGDLAVWDTVAIIDHVREKHPEAVGWPEDPAARALARSITAEMHSGFFALRDELPQNLRARNPVDPAALSETCRQQVARIDRIWTGCRERFGTGGDWLFGDFSIADVFYAPVALRFVTYSIDVSERAQEFMDAVTGTGSVQQWIAAARLESESLPFIDQRMPAEISPLTLG